MTTYLDSVMDAAYALQSLQDTTGRSVPNRYSTSETKVWVTTTNTDKNPLFRVIQEELESRYEIV
jgi:hypothetical protein